MMANRYRGTIYIGVTSALGLRVWDHKNGRMPGFTSLYKTGRLVWYEHRHTMEAAIRREKQLKEWHRAWKIRLIEEMNPEWRDLHEAIDPVATLLDE